MSSPHMRLTGAIKARVPCASLPSKLSRLEAEANEQLVQLILAIDGLVGVKCSRSSQLRARLGRACLTRRRARGKVSYDYAHSRRG
jgi:hypothetical protein